ncbi:MAG: hypothetical protein ABI723_08570 [Bacteroidia bacterium]
MQTVFEDDDKIFAAICAGADGYILKKTPPHELLKAITNKPVFFGKLSGGHRNMFSKLNLCLGLKY